MLFDRIDPQRFVSYLQIIAKLTLIWLPDPGAPFLQILFNHCARCVVFILNFCGFILILFNIIIQKDDPIILVKAFLLVCIIADCVGHLMLIMIQWPRFRKLIDEVTTFFKTATSDEKVVCRKYIRRYIVFQIFLAIFFICAVGAFALGPVILGEPFPIYQIRYPFSLDILRNRIFVYVLQYFIILQPLCILAGDCIIIMLIWYASTQMKLLGLAMSDVNSAVELRKCVEKHVHIISYVAETNRAIELILAKNFTVISITILSTNLQLAYDRSIAVFLQILLISCVASMRIFIYILAGDDLVEVAQKLSWSIYQSPLVVRSPHFRKSASIIMQRSQKSIIITIWGTSLRLSLDFFTTYALRVMSLFMALRVIVDKSI